MTDTPMTCAALDERLADYLEGTLDANERSAVERHLAECPRCASLVNDLQAIALDARALPDLAPARDLWPEIEARIQAPVISLPSAAERASRRRRVSWTIAAAAGLVLATASTTFLATRQWLAPSHPQQVAVAPTGTTTPAVPATVPDTRAAAAPPTTNDQRPTASNVSARKLPVEATYDREIQRLNAIVRDRRSELDPKTVQVIQHNLAVIDAAIAESRAALAKDPRSRFLHDQLNKSLDQKVELLRTVAFLPSRT